MKKCLPSLTSLVLRRTLDRVPAGWLTREEFALSEGYSCGDSARPILIRAVNLGIVERKEFRVIWGNQSKMRPYYRRKK